MFQFQFLNFFLSPAVVAGGLKFEQATTLLFRFPVGHASKKT
jgi:hypothetical protein